MPEYTQTRPAPKPRPQCIIRVVVRNDLEPDAPPVHDKVGDHTERFFRDWINETAYWAMRNRHSMTLYPDDKFQN